MSHPTLQWQWCQILKTWWKYWKRNEDGILSILCQVFACHSHVSWLADSYMFLRLRRKTNIFRSACWIELNSSPWWFMRLLLFVEILQLSLFSLTTVCILIHLHLQITSITVSLPNCWQCR
jgi:hypothetical protein